MTISFDAGEVLEHVHLNNLILAANGDGVISDPDATSLEVIEPATALMAVRVRAGKCKIGKVIESEAGVSNLSHGAASATLYRKDLVSYDPAGNVPRITKGTEHAGSTGDPTYPPDIPAGDILLALVDVDAGVSAITSGDIHDMRIFVERGASYSGASVFGSAAAPTSWTDLDLSSVVGSNRAFAVLKVTNDDTIDPTYSFRPNGDATDYSYSAADATPSSFVLYRSRAALISVITDASGIIEWECTSANDTIINVLSYQELTI